MFPSVMRSNVSVVFLIGGTIYGFNQQENSVETFSFDLLYSLTKPTTSCR